MNLKIVKETQNYYYITDDYDKGTVLAILAEKDSIYQSYDLYQIVSSGEYPTSTTDEWGEIIYYNENLIPSVKFLCRINYFLDTKDLLELLEFDIKELLEGRTPFRELFT